MLCVGVSNVSCDSRMIETNRRQGADYYSWAALVNRGSDIATNTNMSAVKVSESEMACLIIKSTPILITIIYHDDK